MYTDDEIIRVARECQSLDEVMAASHFFRLLIATGLQPATKFLAQIMLMRFSELA